MNFMHVTVNGARLFFDVIGEKLVPDGNRMRERPTLLLLHGGPGFDHSMFKPAFAPLADIAQLVLLDHRGNGRSDSGDPVFWTLDQWGDDVRAFCDTLGIEKPIVLGYSFGGIVAQSYAIRHPDHPAKLILYSTTPVLLDEPYWTPSKRSAVGKRGRSPSDISLVEPRRRRPSSGACVSPYTTKCLRIRSGWNDRSTILLYRSTSLRARARGSTTAHFCTASNAPRWLSVVVRIRGVRRVLTRMLADGIRADLLHLMMFDACGHGPHTEDPDRAMGVLRDFIAGA